MSHSGKLIVIEGACDGIGKTTQYEMLCQRLKEDGHKIYTHHFPSYGTVQGEGVEKFLKGEFGEPKMLSPYFVNELYAYDRKVTWDNELSKYFKEGYNIVLDRYTTSSIIYQSVFLDSLEEKKKFIDYVSQYEYEELKIKKPDLVLFLTAPFEVALKLKQGRLDNDGIKNDVFERDIELMEKIYHNANFIADYLKWDIIPCSLDGVTFRDRQDINNDVYKLVKQKIK